MLCGIPSVTSKKDSRHRPGRKVGNVSRHRPQARYQAAPCPRPTESICPCIVALAHAAFGVCAYITHPPAACHRRTSQTSQTDHLPPTHSLHRKVCRCAVAKRRRSMLLAQGRLNGVCRALTWSAPSPPSAFAGIRALRHIRMPLPHDRLRLPTLGSSSAPSHLIHRSGSAR